MSYSFNTSVVKNITYNNQKVKKWNHNGVRVYNSGSTVTYYVEASTKYVEEVNSGDSCLSPKTFTPSKSGYTFAGWREDKTASGSVLTSKVMGDSPITLYAVFRKTITLTTRISGASSNNSGYEYYNNGNVIYPRFTIANPTKSGWTFLGWSKSSGSTTVSYSTLANKTFTASITLYAVFKCADTTISKSLDCDHNDEWLRGTQNQDTIQSSIDVSKYYAAQISLDRAEADIAFKGRWLQVYVSDGTNDTLVVQSYKPGGDDNVIDQVSTWSPVVTFSASTGTKSIIIKTVAKSYPGGNYEESTGTWRLRVTSIKLFGRTVVG